MRKVKIGRDDITITFSGDDDASAGDDRIFQCTKMQLIDAVSNYPFIYKTLHVTETAANIRKKRNEQYVDLVYFFCDKINFRKPSRAELHILDQTFRSVWRSIRDSYRKTLKQGRPKTYKYSKMLQFLKDAYEEEEQFLEEEELDDEEHDNASENIEHSDTFEQTDTRVPSLQLSPPPAVALSPTTQNEMNQYVEIIDHSYEVDTISVEEEEIEDGQTEIYFEEIVDESSQEQVEEVTKEEIKITNLEFILANLTFFNPLVSKLNMEQVTKFLEVVKTFLRDPDNFP